MAKEYLLFKGFLGQAEATFPPVQYATNYAYDSQFVLTTVPSNAQYAVIEIYERIIPTGGSETLKNCGSVGIRPGGSLRLNADTNNLGYKTSTTSTTLVKGGILMLKWTESQITAQIRGWDNTREILRFPLSADSNSGLIRVHISYFA